MRLLWAGLIVLITSSAALAQARGEVRDIGFAGAYRPDTWVPLLVHLDSTAAETAEYQIQVHQQDLDLDTVVFTRTVTLGPQAHENYWVYFRPQPTNGGLPGSVSSALLGDVLKVYLFDKSGKTQVATLPVQARADSVDPSALGQNGNERGRKVVLVVYDQESARTSEFDRVGGVIEDVQFVMVRADALPDHVLGYQAVDAVLWLDAKFSTIRNTPVLGALQEWVRRGGNLAVIQPSDRTQLEALVSADMLPVVAKTGSAADAAWAIRSHPVTDLEHLKRLARDRSPLFVTAAWDALEKSKSQFDAAVAEARPDAMVDAWIDWPLPATRPATQAFDDAGTPAEPPPPSQTPLIARRAYGLGAVTWVAQDLASNKLAKAPVPAQPTAGDPGIGAGTSLLTNGWPRIWDRVFGWRNQSRTDAEVNLYKRTYPEENSSIYVQQYDLGAPVDMGASLLNRSMEHGARSTAYVFLAILFFIVYWLLAGPGSYLYLAAREKRGLSWMVFGASAVVATLLTVLLVGLLLRGGAEARHLTLVRLIPDQPAADGTPQFQTQMHAWVGLYIPKDGAQTVTTSDPGAGQFAAVVPYAVHPQWLAADKESGFTDTAKYFVNTDLILSGKAASVDFPFRSTAKKIEAQWGGAVSQGIVGSVQNVVAPTDGSPLAGTLTNKTGRDLVNAYLVFTDGWIDANSKSRGADSDRVLYLPKWANGQAINLTETIAKAARLNDHSPGGNTAVYDAMLAPTTDGFSLFFHQGLNSKGMGVDLFDDRSTNFLRSFPIISLIDRIGPFRRDANGKDWERLEPIRRGVREFDMSPQVAAGKLVVLGVAPGGASPLPMQVNGEALGGDGMVLYQAALPIDRSALKPQAQPAASQPATQPAPLVPTQAALLSSSATSPLADAAGPSADR